MNSILKFAPLMQLFMLFGNADFLNAPEFTNVFLMFKMFSKRVRDSEDPGLTQNWKDVQELLHDRVRSSVRLQALKAESPLEVLMILSTID
jgi:hypothetical protein